MEMLGMKDMLVFIDEYSPMAEIWLETLESRDVDAHGIVLEDNPFLPCNMTSIYEHLLLKEEKREFKNKDLFFLFLEIPEYWEIQLDGQNGIIVNNGMRAGIIYFKEPMVKRNISRIEWLKDDGTVYKIDYYNRYGMTYCSAFVDDKGFIYMKTYFTSENKDVININYSNGIVTTFHNGQVSNIFGTMEEFEYYTYREIIASNVPHMLTSAKQMRWISQENDIELSDISFALWKKEDVECYQNEIYTLVKNIPVYILSNMDTVVCEIDITRNEHLVCASKRMYPSVNGTADMLIYTYSDQLHSIDKFIQSIPEARFHIAANTEVSKALYDLANSENVFVYPAIKKEKIFELYEKCDFLLDINESREVNNVVIEASKNGMLILGYEDLLHNKNYVLGECIFKKNEADSLVLKVKLLVNQKDELARLVQKQQEKVMESTRYIMRKK